MDKDELIVQTQLYVYGTAPLVFGILFCLASLLMLYIVGTTKDNLYKSLCAIMFVLFVYNAYIKLNQWWQLRGATPKLLKRKNETPNKKRV